MADTTTTNYAFVKPEVGASSNTWGTKLNTDLDAIDTAIKAAADDADAALTAANAAVPKAGSLAITGNLGFRKDNPGLQFYSPDGTRGYALGALVTNASTGNLIVENVAGTDLLTLSPDGDLSATRRLAAAGTIRSTELSDFGTGEGVELYYDPDGVSAGVGVGYVVAINRTGLVFKRLGLYGSEVHLYHGPTKTLETTASGVTVVGTVSDSGGNVRRPASRLVTTTGNIVAGDMNAIIEKAASGAVSATLVTGLGQRGDIVTFVNSSTSGNLTIARSGTTLYQNGVNADIVVLPGSMASIVRADTTDVWVA